MTDTDDRSLDWDNGYKQGFRDGLHHQGTDVEREALAAEVARLQAENARLRQVTSTYAPHHVAPTEES